MGEEEAYNTKIYTLRNGDIAGLKSGGKLRIQDNAYLSIDNYAVLNFAGEELTPDEFIKFILEEEIKAIVIGQSTDSYTFSIVSQPYDARYITLSLTSAISKEATFTLTSCFAGEELHLMLGIGSASKFNEEIAVLGQGFCTIIDSNGRPLSKIIMYNHSDQTARIHFLAFKDNVWSILSGIAIEEHVA